jgi:phage shock protein A
MQKARLWHYIHALHEQASLKRLKKRLSTEVEEFRSITEFMKAKYSAAEALVRIKETVGFSAEMTVGIALDRAVDKRAKMKAKFQALD